MPESAEAAAYNSLREKISELYAHFPTETHDRVLVFCAYLEETYPDARDHKFFHLLSGSTVKDFYGSVDFLPPDSVAEFINSEYAKAFSKEKAAKT